MEWGVLTQTVDKAGVGAATVQCARSLHLAAKKDGVMLEPLPPTQKGS